VVAGQEFNSFVREHPRAADLAAALVVLALHIVGFEFAGNPDDRPLDLFGVAIVVIPALLTFFRRTQPILALVVATILAMTYWVLDYSGAGAGFAMLVLLYSAAVYASERRRSTRVLIVFTITMLVVLIAGYLSPGEEEVSIGTIVFNLVLFQLAWLAGDAIRNRRAQVRRLETSIRDAEVAREQQMTWAVEQERNRIARELHDVVAHAMSVIVVQAEGAKRLVGKNDEAVSTALKAIEHTGRSNLNDIRGIVGLLRTDGTEYAPAPELTMVGELVQQCIDAGQRVSMSIEGTPRPLPPMIELSGYRVVQESLTNAMKHAGPHATATVTIAYEDESVDISVLDDGRGAAADSPWTPGYGLLGMRERVEAFGGHLSAGPNVGGGYAVRAHLPLPATSSVAL
jgi:signal transduction histidine kinase